MWEDLLAGILRNGEKDKDSDCDDMDLIMGVLKNICIEKFRIEGNEGVYNRV